MAKIVTSTKTVKGSGTSSSTSGSRPCNICHGTGRVPKTNKKKSK